MIREIIIKRKNARSFIVRNHRKKIFNVTFIKKDETKRVMNCRYGVKKGVKNVGLAFDPVKKELMVVFDVDIARAQKELGNYQPSTCYRMINLKTLIKFKMRGKQYLIKD